MLAKILGLKKEEKDFGYIITFPFWLPIRIIEKALDNLKKDYKIKYDEDIKITIGHRVAKIEFDKNNG